MEVQVMAGFSSTGNHITIDQGATFTLAINALASDASQRTLASGFIFKMQGRPNFASSTVVFVVDSADPASGVTMAFSDTDPNITFTFSAAYTAALSAPQTGVYDMELTTSSSGLVERLIQGTFEITPEATKL
jgi:hypothetical protein